MNTCYTCDNFGLCSIENKTCKDWEEWNEETIVLNIEQFARDWLSLHNEKADKELLNKRIEKVKLYNDGKTKDELVDEISNEIFNSVMDKLRGK